MRITGNTPITGVKGPNKKRSAGGGEQFAPETGGAEEPSQSVATAGASGIQGIDSLLALQEVDDGGERRRKAAKHGHTLLDTLEAVRADLLAGVVPEDRLERLAHTVSLRQTSGDPSVDSVLEEIELRVKVELAKLGRFPDA